MLHMKAHICKSRTTQPLSRGSWVSIYQVHHLGPSCINLYDKKMHLSWPRKDIIRHGVVLVVTRKAHHHFHNDSHHCLRLSSLEEHIALSVLSPYLSHSKHSLCLSHYSKRPSLLLCFVIIYPCFALISAWNFFCLSHFSLWELAYSRVMVKGFLSFDVWEMWSCLLAHCCTDAILGHW